MHGATIKKGKNTFIWNLPNDKFPNETIIPQVMSKFLLWCSSHRGEVEVQLYLTSAVERSGCLSPCPWSFTPGKGDRYPFYKSLSESRGQVWMGPENPTWMGFEPRTDQPVANRYTDYPILVTGFVYDPSRTPYTPFIHYNGEGETFLLGVGLTWVIYHIRCCKASCFVWQLT